MQVEQNHALHPVLDPAVEKCKRQNRGKKDAIVDQDESECGSIGSQSLHS